MRAVVVREHGGIEALRLDEVETPTPGPGEVRVRVAAIGINHLDVWVRRGVPGHPFPLPLILGSDIAGTVETVGDGVTGPAPGDRVVLHPVVSCGLCRDCRSGNESLCRDLGILGETRDGGCADYVVVPRANVLPMPEGLDFPEAAAIPLVFLTAWHMLVARAGIRPGQRVLVHAAGSGVSSAAIQIARLHGAAVMATAGSRDKCERALELGADRAVNYREDDFVKAVRDWTGKRGVDIAVDHVGVDTFDRTVRCLARGGSYVTCGATSGHEMKTDFRLVFFKSLSILGSTMGSSHELMEVLDHVESGALKPVVDRVLPLERVAEAHQRLEERAGFGKMILVPGN